MMLHLFTLTFALASAEPAATVPAKSQPAKAGPETKVSPASSPFDVSAAETVIDAKPMFRKKSAAPRAVDAAAPPSKTTPPTDVKPNAAPKPDQSAQPAGKAAKEKLSELDRQLLKELTADDAPPPEEEEADPLMRAGKRMRTVEEQLAKLDPDDATVDVQEKIVADLEAMIQQCQQSSGSPSKSGKKPNGKKRPQQAQAKAQPQQQPGNQPGAQPAQKAGSPPPPSRPRLASDEPETRDVWGHLSELLRDEMSQYAKEQFLPKYREMLEKYYTTIATESQLDD